MTAELLTTELSKYEPLTLFTTDGVRIDAGYLAGGKELCVIVAHGFTGSWRRPTTQMIASELHRFGGVLSIDFRGHGRSAGRSTVGDREVLDVEAAVERARQLGYERVAVAGFSMGGAVAIRHAALNRGVDAVVSVSAPAEWFFRGTKAMRQVHWAIRRPSGRLVTRLARSTRIARRWKTVPEEPREVVDQITPTPLLLVHGDADPFFPLDQVEQLYRAAREPRELWVEPGFGHAETGATPPLVARIGDWIASHAPAARCTGNP